MSVTSGFFNSLNGDRTYNAEQMSEIFDGIINDGVFASIGDTFTVTASGDGVAITVGTGRAWFNSTWILNDSTLSLTCTVSEVLLDRWDAVVIEVDHSDDVRAASIKVIDGTPSSSPSKPDMEDDDYVHQYPLAYIYREAGSEDISQADVTSMIGTSSCPYITGILEVTDIDNIVAQWGAQWAEWFTEQSESVTDEMNDWLSEQQTAFLTWFNNIETIVEGDALTNMANVVVALESQYESFIKNQTLYQDLEDSDGDTILDSDEDEIEGKIVYVIK